MRAFVVFAVGLGVGALATWAGIGAATAAAPAGASVATPARGVCPCPGDANCDGIVDFNDIVTVLGNWLVPCVSDADADGVPDQQDNCPNFPNPAQADIDADGAGDECDNCANLSNPGQADADGDGYGDACDCGPADPTVFPGAVEDCTNGVDDDCDGFVDGNDLDCSGDADMDGVPDIFDNCPSVANPLQEDDDLDGFGAACDCDDGNAQINPGAAEDCMNGIDDDCDGFLDGADFDCNPDWDGDGVANQFDNCPLVFNPTQVDSDGDGFGWHCECADNNPNINPAQTEVCPDGIDNDCDGTIDNCQ